MTIAAVAATAAAAAAAAAAALAEVQQWQQSQQVVSKAQRRRVSPGSRRGFWTRSSCPADITDTEAANFSAHVPNNVCVAVYGVAWCGVVCCGVICPFSYIG